MTRRIKIGEHSYQVHEGDWRSYIMSGDSIIYLEDFKELGIKFQEDTLENKLRDAFNKVLHAEGNYEDSMLAENDYPIVAQAESELVKAKKALDALLKQVRDV